MNQIIKYRTNQWWQPKASIILSAVYLSVLLYNVSWWDTLKYFLPAIITIFGIGIFGHLLNDFFDISADKSVGKKNLLAEISSFRIVLYFVLSLSLSFLPWLVLPYTVFSLNLLLFEFFLLIVYALPFIRLKERGFWALTTDSLYAYVVPAILAFYTFSLLGITYVNHTFLSVSAFLWLLLAGIYNLAIHQLEDYENDLKTNTRTWVTAVGKEKSFRISLHFIWTAHLLSFLFFSISVFYMDMFAGAIFLLILMSKIFFAFGNHYFTLHYRNRNTIYLQQVNFHYHLWMPYVLLLCLVFTNWNFVLLMVFHLVLFNYSILRILIVRFVKQPMAFVINYSIYYLRRLSGQSVEQAMREHYSDSIMEQRTKTNILLANANKEKYTETFVANHFKYLSKEFYVHQFYGGAKPNAEVKRGRILSNFLWIRNYYYLVEDLLGLGEGYFENKSFKNYIVINNIRLVLAEFGTCGIEIFELCKEANVPLLVIFHGYDTHHKNFSPKSNPKYIGLFEYASAIICVSKDIKSTLIKYGANEEKLIYLPCAVDLERFQYSDHSKNENIILAVGRFAETKSPHLTILAFNEVLKQIPNAQLRMVGKDGGGELFEACHILVKALKIEDNVSFLGILSPSEVYEEMKNARVFVQHSITTPIYEDKEGTPVSVMEAMACGLAVIATKHAGIGELIDTNENGILVEEYDYLSMAQKMIEVCLSDETVFRLGKNASESIRNNELISKNEEKLLDIVNEFIIK